MASNSTNSQLPSPEAQFDDETSSRLEAVYLTPDICTQRSLFVDEDLNPQVGSTVLDIGAFFGHNSFENPEPGLRNIFRVAFNEFEHLRHAGCGPGLTTEEVARRVGASGRVIGVDVAQPMLRLATARLACTPWASTLQVRYHAIYRSYKFALALMFGRT